MLLSLSEISNENLISKLKEFKDTENLSVANIIYYLSELDNRGLYRDLGYSSLFSYCTDALGYSESAAYRRVQAARFLKTNPEIYESIKTGKLSLSAVSEIAKIKEANAKMELLKASEGKSARVVQAMAAKFQAPVKSKRETIRAKQVVTSDEPTLFSLQKPIAQTQESYSITIEVDKDFMNLLNETKALIGHRPTSEVFRKTMAEFVDKRTQIKRRVAIKAPVNSRFIPKSVKLLVMDRDNKQCSFVSSDGKRCTEKHSLEFDHKVPYAVGGTNGTENIRLLCKAHNLLHAERFFGKDKVSSYQVKGL